MTSPYVCEFEVENVTQVAPAAPQLEAESRVTSANLLLHQASGSEDWTETYQGFVHILASRPLQGQPVSFSDAMLAWLHAHSSGSLETLEGQARGLSV